MKKIGAIIVDDEALGRSLIQEYLDEYPQIDILAQCRDAHEAFAAINKYQPDLIFLDIQMPEINGFELLDMLEELPLVIFSTAYDQYAIKAFEVNAVDYLLKPYDAERFDLALQRALAHLEKKAGLDQQVKSLLAGLPQNQHSDRLLIKQAGRIVILPVKDIIWIQALDDYAEIHTLGQSYLIQQSLNHLESRLNPEQFVRAHRSYIVNIDAIKDIVAGSAGRYQLILKDQKHVFLSRNGFKKLKRFMI